MAAFRPDHHDLAVGPDDDKGQFGHFGGLGKVDLALSLQDPRNEETQKQKYQGGNIV